MSKNPFNPNEEPVHAPKRNVYDHSYSSLYTTEWGRIDPALCIEVLPGDSFKIDSSIAIQGMPTVFPLQTRVRASVSYFLARNRTVHDEFEDFIFKTKEITPPWLRLNSDRAKQMISTGSLGDFFNIPTTVGTSNKVTLTKQFFEPVVIGSRSTLLPLPTVYNSFQPLPPLDFIPSYNATQFANATFTGYLLPRLNYTEDTVITAPWTISDNSVSLGYIVVIDGKNYFVPTNISVVSNVATVDSFNILTTIRTYLPKYIPTEHPVYLVRQLYDSAGKSTYSGFSYDVGVATYFNYNDVTITNVYTANIIDATSSSVLSSNPFVGNNPELRLSAYKWRHYEQICNYYFRNDKNNPYILNNEPQYNEFIPSHASGPDDNLYNFHYRNWELDRFTSAVQTPQFGEAPLVGLTFNRDGTSATLTFSATPEDGTETNYTATVGLDDDDHIANIADFSRDLPAANLAKLQEMVNYGISINDLRVTNSFQRFLENTLRRGLRYRNQLLSHFGHSVDYPDIDVPQYLGGFSGELQVSKITNTAESPNAGLGDFVGSLSGQLSGKPIHCYCPEHGYIFAMVSITPIPTYSQVCGKDNLKSSPFDYFLPEFGKIGYVPIHYSEVMPLQTGIGESVHDVFAYQKAHYDLMNHLDEVHCDFRTSLKDFVLSRTFSQRPVLTEDFVRVKPEQLNDVFVSNNIADAYGSSSKFLVNIYHHIIAKRPIPRIGTPSLE